MASCMRVPLLTRRVNMTWIRLARSAMATEESAPRWQRVIEKALEEDKKANVYQLATLDTSTDSSGASVALPRVRSLIHRAFLAPRSSTHPLLLTTTDARTPKARQLAQNARVELAWWLPASQEQMRVAGTAHVLPAPDFALRAADAASAAIEDATRALEKAFAREALGGRGFDWEALRAQQFDSMSGHMKASWVRPVPGTSLQGVSGYDAAKTWPESLPKLRDSNADGATRKLVQEALGNFALVLIDPTEVDYVELGVVPNRRTRFFKNKEGKWDEEAVVP
ncbi:pyridoxamine 5'-phosphate oxidase-domain-containing protein [Phellopilus nigrolimitatus]|nr:pyridoxamine 5'-phosphate oxidase-domain-containing protein [Phellopilus nigrolimitatus]